ncbi:hypothetical protein EI555_013790, partial [Monodon monoceros]
PRQVPPARARIRPVSWAGSPILFPPRGWGNGAVALTWLVRGGLDGHGSGARGGTGSPEKDRLFGRGAGESGRQAALSPVSEAAPWTPTRSFSAAARPPSHYPPPSSAAAAAAASSTSSSAETPRPLHTLSHHAAGEPLPPTRHFRAQVARSGPGADRQAAKILLSSGMMSPGVLSCNPEPYRVLILLTFAKPAPAI